MSNSRTVERQVSQGFSSQLSRDFESPVIITDSQERFSERLQELKKLSKHQVDLYKEMLLELMLVRNPSYKNQPELISSRFSDFLKNEIGESDIEKKGAWVLYGNGVLIHTLNKDDYFELRTSRNVGLLTREELNIFRTSKIAIGGLSVGGLCASTLAMEGVENFYITDFDKLAASNLNRINSSLSYVGVDKVDIVAQKIWDVDPFILVEKDNRGFVESSINAMFNEGSMPDVVIDAMDSMEAKISIREECKKFGIPLVWMIDMGDGLVQIGTERYDLDRNYPAFHGALAKNESKLGRPLNYLESCFSIFNNNRLPHRMASSFMSACNNEGAGVSQLSGTVSIAAGAISKVVRRILLGQNVIPEFFVDIDQLADPEYKTIREEDKNQTLKLIDSLWMM